MAPDPDAAPEPRDDHWRRRQASFGSEPWHYGAHRPGYPAAAFAQILDHAGVAPGDRVLEVGCGAGQTTLALARRGLRVHAVEFNPALAAHVRDRAAETGSPVTVDVGRFEDWTPPVGGFPLLVATASFHWLDPERRVALAADALAPGGTLALMWNRHVAVPADGGFHEAVQADFARLGLPTRSEPLPDAARLPAPYAAEILAEPRFARVEVHRYPWEWHFTAEKYIELLETYSDFRVREPEVKQALYAAIAERARRDFGDRIVRGVVSLLYLARRS